MRPYVTKILSLRNNKNLLTPVKTGCKVETWECLFGSFGPNAKLLNGEVMPRRDMGNFAGVFRMQTNWK